MNFIYPLGLLGLIGIIVLIIIYLIKPNYQQKLLSTTFIWKRSLKFRRKRIPINKFRNLLILLCQILIITLAAILIAAPYLPSAVDKNSNEKILIIDASASMLARQEGGETRFERAIKEIRALGESVIDKGDRVSLILANQEAKTILTRSDDKEAFNDKLDELVKIEVGSLELPLGCTFGEADIDGAMAKAQDFLILNPVAEVQLYTATQYKLTADNKVVIKNVAQNEGDDREWNAAIVDVVVEFYEGYYRFDIHVASYNRDENITVNFLAYGVNGGDADKAVVPDPNKPLEKAQCSDGATAVVTLSSYNLPIYSYSSITISIDVKDSFSYDNTYYLNGGQKEKLKIMYVSPSEWKNVFFESIITSIHVNLSSRWDVFYEITSLDALERNGRTLEDASCDLYIIEHIMPEQIPTSGVVLLVNPGEAPSNSGIRLGSLTDRSTEDKEDCYLLAGENSEIMKYMEPSLIMVNSYRPILTIDKEFVPLMYANSSDIVFAVKNTKSSKIAVISFTSLYTDFTLSPSFPFMMYGIFDCMFPPTVKKHVYDVGETVVFHQPYSAMEESKQTINIQGGVAGMDSDITSDYGSIVHYVPGSYVTSQFLLSQERSITDGYFVKVSANQSNFIKVSAFRAPIAPEVDKNDLEIYIYFAAILCALVFIERLLHVKEEF